MNIKDYEVASEKKVNLCKFFAAVMTYLKGGSKCSLWLPSWKMLDVRQGYQIGLLQPTSVVHCVENNSQLKKECPQASKATEIMEAQRKLTPQPMRDNILIHEANFGDVPVENADLVVADLCGWPDSSLAEKLDKQLSLMSQGGSFSVTWNLVYRIGKKGFGYEVGNAMWEAIARHTSLQTILADFGVAKTCKRYAAKSSNGASRQLINANGDVNNVPRYAGAYTAMMYALVAENWFFDKPRTTVYYDTQPMMTFEVHNLQPRKNKSSLVNDLREAIFAIA